MLATILGVIALLIFARFLTTSAGEVLVFVIIVSAWVLVFLPSANMDKPMVERQRVYVEQQTGLDCDRLILGRPSAPDIVCDAPVDWREQQRADMQRISGLDCSIMPDRALDLVCVNKDGEPVLEANSVPPQ
jgi:hypothetical protein